MTSSFSWMDYSDRDRRRAMEIIELFREEDTRDELGIGVIRDAFADHFFPGTSTIQTRVRYFLFIPWIFQMGDGGVSPLADKIRWRQDQLRRSLVEGKEDTGVIGYRAKAAVQRLPSSVYWQGLKKWGILRFAGSEADYFRYHHRQRVIEAPLINDDGDLAGAPLESLWHPKLPAPSKGWLNATTFQLTREEALFLAERIRQSANQSLLAWLIDQETEPKKSRFFWELVTPEQLPPYLVEQLTHGRHFSEAIHGAALLYNLMLAEEKDWTENVENYRVRIAEWWNLLHSSSATGFGDWNRSAFWALLANWQSRVTPQCRLFVNGWLDILGKFRRPEEVIGDSSLRDLIRQREHQIKRQRKRLDNPRALDNWSGASGTAQLDYRWTSPVRALVCDVIRGLRGKE